MGKHTVKLTDFGDATPRGPQFCPDGKVMTGIRWKTGRAHALNAPSINGITGFWCKDTHKMNQNNHGDTTFVKTDNNWGDTGGKSQDSRCRPDSALKGGKFWFEYADKIGQAQLFCAPFKTHSSQKPHDLHKLKVVGGGPNLQKNNPKAIGWYWPDWGLGKYGNFMNGLGARVHTKRGEQKIWELDLHHKNYDDVRDILNNLDKQYECCSGQNLNKVACGKYYNRGSTECNSVMNKYCAKGDNIAKDGCQNMCRKNKTVQCDENMVAYCKRQKEKVKPSVKECREKKKKELLAKYKDSEIEIDQAEIDAIEEECVEKHKSPELCNCINSKSIAPHCWDPKCTATSAYQTINQDRTEPGGCGVYCSQEINVVESGGDTSIDRTKFEQACGSEKAKELEDAIDPSDADDEPDDIVPEEGEEEDDDGKEEQPEKERSNGNDYTWIYVTLIIIVALIIILALGLTGLWFLLF